MASKDRPSRSGLITSWTRPTCPASASARTVREKELAKQRRASRPGTLVFGDHTYRLKGIARATRPFDHTQSRPLRFIKSKQFSVAPAEFSEVVHERAASGRCLLGKQYGGLQIALLILMRQIQQRGPDAHGSGPLGFSLRRQLRCDERRGLFPSSGTTNFCGRGGGADVLSLGFVARQDGAAGGRWWWCGHGFAGRARHIFSLGHGSVPCSGLGPKGRCELPFGPRSCYHERMARANGVDTRKRRPGQTGSLIGVRLQPDQLADLDAWIRARADDGLSRPEAIRQLVEAALKAQSEAGKAKGGRLSRYICCLCEKEFPFGAGVYGGRPLPGLGDLMVCRLCDQLNHDGVVLETHPHFRERLEALGVAPTLNASGWFDLPPRR